MPPEIVIRINPFVSNKIRDKEIKVERDENEISSSFEEKERIFFERISYI